MIVDELFGRFKPISKLVKAFILVLLFPLKSAHNILAYISDCCTPVSHVPREVFWYGWLSCNYLSKIISTVYEREVLSGFDRDPKFSIRPVGQALGWVPKKSGWAGNSQSRNDLCLFGDLIACDKRFIRPRAQVALSNTRSLLYRYEVSSLRILLVSRS